jgi:hypothetical protein
VAHANLGYILASTGKTDEASKQYEAALELQPRFDAARYALARLDATDTPQNRGSMPTMSGPRLAGTSSAHPPASPTASVVVPVAASPPAISAPIADGSVPIIVPTPIAIGSADALSPPQPPVAGDRNLSRASADTGFAVPTGRTAPSSSLHR